MNAKWRLAALSALTVLFTAQSALALGVVAVGQTDSQTIPAIEEEFFFVVYDEANQREHVILAARLSPAAPRITLGFPVPSAPSIEPLPSFDPGAALFALVAPGERRARSRPPAAPPPWPTRGVTLEGQTTRALAGDALFDAAWLKAYAEAGLPFVAALSIVTPEDGRLSTTTPGALLSFTTDRPLLPRKEPRRASPADEPPGDPNAASGPLEIRAIRIEPKDAGPGAEPAARVLRARSGPLLDCYEVLLEHHPEEPATLTLEATIRPKGETAALKMVATQTDSPDPTEPDKKAFAACVAAELRKKQFPRTDEGWKLSAELSFKPPRARSRRSHVVVLGASRRVWRDPPASARKEHDVEVAAEDVDRAFGQTLRRSLGLGDGQPFWLTHWLDRDERRASAADAIFEREEPPPVAAPPNAKASATDGPANGLRPARAKAGLSRRAKGGLAALALVALTVALGLWIGLEGGGRRDR